MKIRLLLTILLLTATIAANTQIMERTFLKKVLTNLEKIESATYYVIVDQEGIRSYSKENTDKEIIHTIKELL